MAHISEAKKETVSQFASLIDKYPVIAIVNMVNLPTKQLQVMRAKLRDKDAVLKMTKKRLIKIALDKSKKSKIKNLQKHLEGMPALIFTEDNPFKLYIELQKTKSKAPAKAGQEAPNDISVKAGPTNFSPGPIIGQLGKFGIKTGVEAGKIVIKDDSVIVKKGEVITDELAKILARLKIEPMEIGLNLTAVYENGNIYESEILHVDPEEYKNNICNAYFETLNLALFIAYPSHDTIDGLLNKAHNESLCLAISLNILTDATVVNVLKKAHSEMRSLSSKLPTEPAEEKTEEKPSEEVPKETESKEPVKEPKTEEVSEEQKTEETPKEKKSEESDEPKESNKKESDAAGLGSLFGG